MIVEALVFYMLGSLAVIAGFMVIASRNPVHSVLFLIMAFFNAAGLFVLMGAEFLAMILIIVYVGAVAVLFLFVVMMLDINYVKIRQGFLQYLPIGAVIGLVLFVELMMILGTIYLVPAEAMAPAAAAAPEIAKVDNVRALGRLLYTEYVYLFQGAGMVLLVAMIGAIVLTHRARPGVRRQKIAAQVRRRREEGVELHDMPSGKGV